MHDTNPNANTTNTPYCGSSCEKVTGSNVINVLKGRGDGGGGLGGVPPPHPQELKLFCWSQIAEGHG